MVEGQNGTAPKQPSFANQLGRRNLTPERMEVYISQLYRAAKKSEGFKPGDEGGPGRGNKTGAQNEPVFKSHETAKKVGEQVGKSENTSDLSLINVISF